MTLTVTNQRPGTLVPNFTANPSVLVDPPAYMGEVLSPLNEPLNPATTVMVTDGQGNSLDSVQVIQQVIDACDGALDPQRITSVHSLFGQTLVNYNTPSQMLPQEVFVRQAMAEHKLPDPSPTVHYTAGTDVIPAAKQLLSGDPDGPSMLLATLGASYRVNSLGFYVQNQAELDAFTQYVVQRATADAAYLDSDTRDKFNEMSKLSFDKDLVWGLTLRKDEADGNDPWSFARTLLHYTLEYVHGGSNIHGAPNQTAVDPQKAGLLPFSLTELVVPLTMVLVNVEAHARATGAAVDSEWRILKRALTSPVRVVSKNRINRLDATARAAQKINQAIASKNSGSNLNRSKAVGFRKQPPPRTVIQRELVRTLKTMERVNRSHNAFSVKQSSFMVANRRDPDNIDRPGVLNQLRFWPDIHVYLDNSASISEENYQATMLMLIRLVRKMNTSLYFNSFAEELSYETIVRTKNRPIKSIWREFRKVPKISGGTDYTPIWSYIQASKERRKRLNLVITDFEWAPYGHHYDHPVNIRYAPMSGLDWSTQTYYAKQFAAAMKYLDPNIGSKLIGMTK